MNSFFDTLHPVLLWVGKVSWQASVLVLCVLAIQGLLRDRLPPGVRYGLWLLVAIRLALPVSVPSRCSVFNWVAVGPFRGGAADSAPATPALAAASLPTRPIAVGTAGEATEVADRAGVAVESAASAPSVPGGASSSAAVAPGAEARAGLPASGPLATLAPRPPVSSQQTRADAQAPPAPGARPSSPTRWVTVLWLLGAVCLGARLAWEHRRVGAALRRARPIDSPALQAVLDEVRRSLGVRAECDLRVSDRVGTPALAGTWRPRLLVPTALVERLTAEEWRHVFRHELAHYCRRDAWMNWVLAGLQIVHWFNPLVWLGFGRLRADRELACDAWALRGAGEAEAKAYGRAMVKVLESLASATPVPGLVALFEDRREVARRLRWIARYPAGLRHSWAWAISLVGLGAMGLSDAGESQAPLTRGEPQTAAVAPSLPLAEEPLGGELALASALPPLVPEGETNRVRLTVYTRDAATGKAFADAKVIVLATMTDLSRRAVEGPVEVDGAFRTWVPGAGATVRGTSVTVERPDRVAKTLQFWEEDIPRRGEATPRPWFPTEVTVELRPGVRIGGRVREAEGRPVAGARVYIELQDRGPVSVQRAGVPCREYEVCGPTPMNGRQLPVAVTDAEGRWAFARFPSNAAPPRLRIERAEGASEYFGAGSRLRFPGVEPDSPARQIETARWLNELLQATAECVLSEGSTVSGRVVDAAGRPIPRVRVGVRSGFFLSLERQYRADAQGRFLLAHRSEKELAFSVSAPGHAWVSRTVAVETDPCEVTLRLPDPQPLRIQAVDMDSGEPLAGAVLKLTGGSASVWSGVTGPDGRVVWIEAPVAETEYRLQAPGYRALSATLAGGGTEVRLSLCRRRDGGAMLWLEVEDADTGSPLAPYSVECHVPGRADRWQWLAENASGAVHLWLAALSRESLPGPVRISAEGYEPELWNPWAAGNDRYRRFRLRRAAPIQGVVRSPVGVPLGDVEVRVSTFGADLSGTFDGSALGVETYRSDERGAYSFPLPGGDLPVVFKHVDGYRIASVGELRRSPEVRLQAWGRIEGEARIGPSPAALETVYLERLGTRDVQFIQTFRFRTQALTDRDGRFHFEKVPAGEYTLGRELSREPAVRLRQPPRLSVQPVTVVAGETNRLVYGGTGRRVAMRWPSPTPRGKRPWLDLVLLLERRTPEVPLPRLEDYASFERYQVARANASRNSAWIRRERERRVYPVTADREGNLWAEDVVPGSYSLTRLAPNGPVPVLTVTTPLTRREFVVPEPTPGREREPVDFGAIEVEDEL